MGLFCADRRRTFNGEGSGARRAGMFNKNSFDSSPFIRLESPRCTSARLFPSERLTMTIGQSMLGEFDQEMQNTRKTLERVPDEKWNWKPHEKSGTVGWLAGHIATMPGWIGMTLQTEELDYAPVGGPSYEPPKIENRQQLLAEFDKNATEARAALASASDADMMKDWTLKA